MTTYILLFIFCIIISRIGDRSFNHQTKVICTTVIVFAMSIVGGLRDIGIGTDTEIYTESYFIEAQYITTISDLIEKIDNYDIGYLALNCIARLFGDKPQAALFISQFFSLGLIFSSAYKISEKIGAKEFSYFTILFCFIFYNMTYNYMRQFCALSIVLWGLYFVIQHKWFFYVITQTLAYFFHTSSILFILVAMYYFVVNMVENDKIKKILLVLFGLIPILFLIMYYTILPQLMGLGLVSELYAKRYGIDNEYFSGSGLGIRSGIINITILILIYFNSNQFKKDYQFQSLLYVSYFSTSLLSIYIFFLYRLALYFSIPLVIYLASYISISKNKWISYIYIFFIIIEWYILYVKSNQCETYPYKSMLIGI